MIKVPDNVLSELCLKFGTNKDDIKYLGGGREDSDGIVYTYQGGKGVNVLKILAIPVKETEGLHNLEERIKFAGFLGDNDIDIAAPRPNDNGSLYETVNDDKYIFTAYKMDMREGHHAKPEEWTPDFYHSWGKVTGKLHRVTKSYPHWAIMPGHDGKASAGWEEELNIFYNWCKDDDVKQRWLDMKQTLSALPFSRDTFGFIHNDNHVNNVLWDRSSITLIDFDVANCHFFINDVAVALQGMLFDAAGGMISPVNDYDAIKSAVNNFMDGYEEENHLDDFWLKSIDTFVSYRRLLLFTVMQEWLNTQPELKQGFKDSMENPPVIYV